METNYKRTVAGSVGAGISSVFNASGRQYYILEHKTETPFHHAGESQKIIIDQIEIGRSSSCQVRFDETQDTVSRRHAAIVREGDKWKIINLSQTNATFVNGLPINGERVLSSGDEIRLSSKGPVLGFIVPQGSQSLVSSIGLTERMNLFRKQALRPYKTALIVLFIVFAVAITALVSWKIHDDKIYQGQINEKQQQIDNVLQEIDRKNSQISSIKIELENINERSEAEVDAIRIQLEKDEMEKMNLIKQSNMLMEQLDSLKNADKTPKNNTHDTGNKQSKTGPVEMEKTNNVTPETPRKKSIEELINETRKDNPTIQ